MNIAIATEADQDTEAPTSKAKGKAKAKGHGHGLELLADAHLKLREGVHYALVGRNGSGKSVLLRTIADKLIPGFPLSVRVAFLQLM